MKGKFAAILLAAICISACLAFISPDSTLPAASGSPAVTARESFLGGSSVGEVLVDDQVVFRIRTSAGGYTPFERAQVIAARLEQLMGDSLQPEDITTGRVRGLEVVLARGEVVVTADPAHALISDTTPIELADLWAQRLENAVAGRPVTETPVAQKVVPIISVGSGARVGGALVAGAQDKLDEVKAVAQIEGDFGRSVRVRALIPVSTEDVVQEISRVPETSVIGLVDIRL